MGLAHRFVLFSSGAHSWLLMLVSISDGDCLSCQTECSCWGSLVQIVFYFIWGNCLIAFTFLASTLFTSTKTAVVTAFLWVFGTGGPLLCPLPLNSHGVGISWEHYMYFFSVWNKGSVLSGLYRTQKKLSHTLGPTFACLSSLSTVLCVGAMYC